MTSEGKYEVVLYDDKFTWRDVDVLFEKCFADEDLHQVMVDRDLTDLEDLDLDTFHEKIPRHHPAYVKVVKEYIANNQDDRLAVAEISDPRYDIALDENGDEYIISVDTLPYNATNLTMSN